MIKSKIFFVLVLVTAFAKAQTTNPALLVTIQKASQSEINAYVIADLELGMLVYNTDVNRIFEYTTSGFVQILTTNDVNETVTTLVNNGDGTFTYTSEDNSTTNFDTNDTLTTFLQDDANVTGEITYTDEAGNQSTAQVVSADTDNQIEVGSDGGAYLGPTVHNGFFIISGDGTVTVSGIPFEPSQVTFVAHANVESLSISADNGVGDNARGIYNSYGSMNGFVNNSSGTLQQQVIYVGGHGNSINDISRYASSAHCIGIRYGDQNGRSLGRISGAFDAFTADGFTINVTYVNGVVSSNTTSTNLTLRVRPDDVQNEDIVVLYTAYR